MAGSLPLLPHRLMVRGETRRSSATSRTVNRSGRFLISSFLFVILGHYDSNISRIVSIGSRLIWNDRCIDMVGSAMT